MSTTWTLENDVELIRRHTQKERVRGILRSANDRGFCTLAFNAIGLPNGRNRVYELRDDDGLDIATVACDLGLYHPGENAPAHVRFIWFWNPKPRQLALLAI